MYEPVKRCDEAPGLADQGLRNMVNELVTGDRYRSVERLRTITRPTVSAGRYDVDPTGHQARS
jgi:hypothetical protein